MESKETLLPGDIIIRICPETHKPVLAQIIERTEVLCLHEDSVDLDIRAVEDWLKQQK